MNKEKIDEKKSDKKKPYTEPKVLATYDRDELKHVIMPHGPAIGTSGCGCGCG